MAVPRSGLLQAWPHQPVRWFHLHMEAPLPFCSALQRWAVRGVAGCTYSWQAPAEWSYRCGRLGAWQGPGCHACSPVRPVADTAVLSPAP